MIKSEKIKNIKKTLAMTLVATMLVSGSGVSANAAGTVEANSVKDTVYKASDAADLDSHVQALSGDIGVRLMGTPNEKAAAEYIEQQLDSLGYNAEIQEYMLPESKQTTVSSIKMGGKEYYGNYYYSGTMETLTNPVFADCTSDGSNLDVISEWSVEKGEVILVNESLFTALEAASAEKAEGDEAYTAMTYDDYMSAAIEKAETSEAAAMIVYNDASNRQLSLKNITDNQVPVMAFNITAGQMIKEGTPVDSISTVDRSISWNVCAVKEASTPEPEAIIHITGHLDSVMGSPGATDNASAVAALIELADMYKDVNTGGVELRFVAVGGEEGGLNGSKAYADALSDEEAAISLNFNMDMLSTSWAEADTVSLDINPYGTGVFNIAAALIITGSEDLQWIEGTENVRWFQYGASDHVSFYNNGIDAASMIRTTDETDDIEPVNHTAQDSIADNYSLDRLEECTNMISKGIAMAVDNGLSKVLDYVVSGNKIVVKDASQLAALYDSVEYTFDNGEKITASSADYFTATIPEGATLVSATGTGEGTANVKGTFDRDKVLDYTTGLSLNEIEYSEILEGTGVNVTDVLTNDGKVRVKFEEVPVGAVTYQIAYKKTDLGATAAYNVIETDSTNVLIDDLEENTKYTVKVKAILKDGNTVISESDYSDLNWAIATKSGEYELPAVSDVTVLAGKGMLGIFTDPQSVEGDVKVQVKYKKTSEPSSEYKNVNGGSGILLETLDRNTKYTIKVRYYIKDIKGEVEFGEYSDLVRIVTE